MSALIKALLEAVGELIQAAIVSNAEQERQALLKIQRAVSDEIARREATDA